MLTRVATGLADPADPFLTGRRKTQLMDTRAERELDMGRRQDIWR
jgi:hypothetical protein